jgi:hypothetical protein
MKITTENGKRVKTYADGRRYYELKEVWRFNFDLDFYAKTIWFPADQFKITEKLPGGNGETKETFFDGAYMFWKNGMRHRLDGPAIAHPDGRKFYFFEDALHRIGGPAATDETGEYWWIHGVKIACKTQKEFERLTGYTFAYFASQNKYCDSTGMMIDSHRV